MQEQVLTIDHLIEIETGIAVFSNNCLLDRILFLYRVQFIQLLGTHKSVMFTFGVNFTLFEKMTGQ